MKVAELALQTEKVFEKVYDRLTHVEYDLTEFKGELREFKGEVTSSLKGISKTLDALVHKTDAYYQETILLTHHIHRHENWIEQIADG